MKDCEEIEPNTETYWDTSSQFEGSNDLDFEEEIYWEASEAVTEHKEDYERYLDTSSRPWEGDDQEPKEKIYWKISEAKGIQNGKPPR